MVHFAYFYSTRVVRTIVYNEDFLSLWNKRVNANINIDGA